MIKTAQDVPFSAGMFAYFNKLLEILRSIWYNFN